jgi:farnesyl-diphosphate farnesyltransferase
MYMESRRIQRLVPDDPNLLFCYSMLNRVSRSFAIVIQMLPECLRDAICVFYLTLRALDTVEDDMALPNERKLPLLPTFYDKMRDE